MQLINTENRVTQRSSIPLPVRVLVKEDQLNTWTEETTLRDVSALGSAFRLKKPIQRGRIMLLTINMPRELRRFDLDLAEYNIWAISRRCVEISVLRGDPYYVIGAAFIGRVPPTDHLHQPAELFDLAHDQPANDGFWSVTRVHLSDDGDADGVDLRRHSRLEIPEDLLLELTDENGKVLAHESTITTNISIGGASVFTEMSLEAGALLRVTSKRANVTIISIVRGKEVGLDGLTRLHLEFIDKQFPLDGIN